MISNENLHSRDYFGATEKGDKEKEIAALDWRRKRWGTETGGLRAPQNWGTIIVKNVSWNYVMITAADWVRTVTLSETFRPFQYEHFFSEFLRKGEEDEEENFSFKIRPHQKFIHWLDERASWMCVPPATCSQFELIFDSILNFGGGGGVAALIIFHQNNLCAAHRVSGFCFVFLFHQCYWFDQCCRIYLVNFCLLQTVRNAHKKTPFWTMCMVDSIEVSFFPLSLFSSLINKCNSCAAIYSSTNAANDEI